MKNIICCFKRSFGWFTHSSPSLIHCFDLISPFDLFRFQTNKAKQTRLWTAACYFSLWHISKRSFISGASGRTLFGALTRSSLQLSAELFWTSLRDEQTVASCFGAWLNSRASGRPAVPSLRHRTRVLSSAANLRLAASVFTASAGRQLSYSLPTGRSVFVQQREKKQNKTQKPPRHPRVPPTARYFQMPDDSEAAITVCTQVPLMHLGDCRSLPRPLCASPPDVLISQGRPSRGADAQRLSCPGIKSSATRMKFKLVSAAGTSQPFSHSQQGDFSPHLFSAFMRTKKKKNLLGGFLFQIHQIGSIKKHGDE